LNDACPADLDRRVPGLFQVAREIVAGGHDKSVTQARSRSFVERPAESTKPDSAYESLFARRAGLALETRRTCTLDPMQLQSARLCLDCDEVHDGQRCPHCASETFAYITRWVPVPDRPDRPDRVDRSDRPQTRARTPEPSSPETLGAYREMLLPDQQGSGKWKTIRRGAVGLALFGIAGWLWRQNRSGDEPDQTTGDEPSQQQRT